MIRSLAMPAVVTTLSLVIGVAATMAYFGIYRLGDFYILVAIWALGISVSLLGASVGMFLPRLLSLPVALAAIFTIAYVPMTMKESWVRSLLGGGIGPSNLYQLSTQTLIATLVTSLSFMVWSACMIATGLPNAHKRWSRSLLTLCLVVCISWAAHSVRNLGFIPLVGRDIDTVCSDNVPQWCVAAWNSDELSAFVALNPKIHEIEQRTGARFPARLSQEAPPGPALSTNVDALSPLPSIKLDDGTKDVYRAVELGLSTTVNPCQQVPPFMNLTVAVYASEWWSSQLQGTPLYGNGAHDLETDVPAQTIRAMTEREQGAWVNSVFEAPRTCTTPLTLPGLDSVGNPLPPTTPKATP
ncbi:hypothetical protein JT358_05225 [Micrococcales bacterium 31B]|nr:hypothetical protein [Micrococcales bacterium 31B]